MIRSDLRVPVRHSRTASRLFGGEAVIISPAEGMVRMLNPVGSRIWELADGTRTSEDIAVALTAEFAVDLDHARASVVGFLGQLAERGLIEWRPGLSGAGGPEDGAQTNG